MSIYSLSGYKGSTPTGQKFGVWLGKRRRHYMDDVSSRSKLARVHGGRGDRAEGVDAARAEASAGRDEKDLVN